MSSFLLLNPLIQVCDLAHEWIILKGGPDSGRIKSYVAHLPQALLQVSTRPRATLHTRGRQRHTAQLRPGHLRSIHAKVIGCELNAEVGCIYKHALRSGVTSLDNLSSVSIGSGG
jgi:hypothetical protein